MARIAGVDLPNNKRGEIGLTYIYGIGRSSAREILEKCGIDYDIKVGEWNDDQVADQVGDYLRTELAGTKDDRQSENRVSNADHQETGKRAVGHLHARGRRKSQH